MADRERRTGKVRDYKKLHDFSTADIYHVVERKRYRPKSKIFQVERLLSRRKSGNDFEYLIKWKGWSMSSCTWEPSFHLTKELIRVYNKPPKPSESEIASASDGFCLAVKSLLKSNAVKAQHTCTVAMKNDVYRYFFNNKGTLSRDSKHFMFNLKDFSKLSLPHHWWYILDVNGQGKAVDFPLKMKAYLGSSPKHFIMQAGKLIEAPRMPLEMVSLTINTKACSREYVPSS